MFLCILAVYMASCGYLVAFVRGEDRSETNHRIKARCSVFLGESNATCINVADCMPRSPNDRLS